MLRVPTVPFAIRMPAGRLFAPFAIEPWWVTHRRDG